MTPKSDLQVVILSDLHPRLELGGGGAIAYEFHQNLLKLGIRSEFWYTDQNEFNPTDCDANEISFHYKESKVNFVRKLREAIGPILLIRLFASIIRRRPNVIWIHQVGNRFPFLVIPLLRVLGIRTLMTVHDYLSISKFKIAPRNPEKFEINSQIELNLNLSLYQNLRRFLNIRMINTANSRVAVSVLQRDILESQGMKVDLVIPNGVQRCEHDNLDLVISREIRSVLFAGRLNGKGLDILCRAIEASDQNWVLHLAGNDDLEQFCRKNYPSIEFIFHGKLERFALCELMHSMDLVSVLSQYFDPYPTISLEAVAHGVFFMTTPCSGTALLLSEAGLEEIVFPVSIIPSLNKVFQETQRLKSELRGLKHVIPTPQEVTTKYLKMLL